MLFSIIKTVKCAVLICGATVRPKRGSSLEATTIVGNHAFAFEIRSQHLDYRVQPDAEIIPLETLPDEVELLRKLMANLKMDFGAADFKTDPKTKQLVFLELNSSPMFVRFDQILKGALCEAMIQTLIG